MRTICYATAFVLIAATTVLCVNGLGGWKDMDLNDETVLQAGNFAHQEMKLKSNSMYRTRMGKVVKASSQLVAGIKYRLTMEVDVTDCRENGQELENLVGCHTIRMEKCEVEVWYQAWRSPAMQLTSFNCENANVPQQESSESKEEEERPSVIGGPTSVDLESDTVKDAVSFSIGELNSGSNGIYAIQLSSVKSATTQIVSGILVKAKVAVMLTSCTERGTMVHQCASNSYQRETVECLVEVWDQPWRTPRHLLTKHECGPSAQGEDTALRFVPGGLVGGGGHDGSNVVDSRPQIGFSLSHFQEFKTKFGRVYKNQEEEQMRYEQFRTNMRRAQFIQDHDLGDAVYGATRFADFTPEEFQAFVSKTWDKNANLNLKPAKIPNVDPPKEFDWRQKGAVTEVKNQGSCGSCWAFCVTGNIEGQWAIKKSELVNLSEQQLVDCDKIDEGCNGGLPSQAYEEILRMGGLETEEDYPYKGIDDKCTFSPDKIKVYINGSVNISKDEGEMAQWLSQNGPMAIGINAMAMQFYFGGISHPWKILCPDALNHGVLIVGYGVKHRTFFGDTPYWIVKNSWGKGWGESGYYMVYRGDGTCGLNEMVSSATVE